MKYFGCIDQGTTSSRFIVFNDKGQIVEAMDRFISEKVEAEIQELAHKSGYESQDQMDKLMLERWQLRYQLNL